MILHISAIFILLFLNSPFLGDLYASQSCFVALFTSFCYGTLLYGIFLHNSTFCFVLIIV